MTILLSGITGFVGSYLQKNLLHLNYEVRGLLLRKKRWQDDFKAQHLALIHLAGKAHSTNNKISRETYFEVNCDLTKEVYDKFLKDKNTLKFIFISSIAAVESKSYQLLTEVDEASPSGYYGASKRAAEIYILNNLPSDSGKKVYIIRPPMIHGPGNKGNLNMLFNIVKKGIPWPLGKFDNKRSFLSIDNFCFAINELLQKDIPTGIYHLADDEPVSTNEIVKMISGVLQKNPRIWNIPKSIIIHIAKIGNFLPLPLNEDRLNKLTEDFLVSNEKFVKAIGKPLPLSSKKGLMKTIKSLIQ